MKKPRRGLSYGRASTLGQFTDEKGLRVDDATPEAQKNRCSDYARYLESKKNVRHQIVEHISDEGFSGKNTNRPGYQRMWDLINAESIDFIIAPELSRLSRSVTDFLELVAHCERHKVDMFIIGLDLDTSTPIGRVIVIILVALAQFEREMTSVRVKENALSRLLTDGKINGAAEILGLDRSSTQRGHFDRNEEELLRAEKILRLFVQVSSKAKLLETARRLGLTGKSGRELTQHALDTMLENVRWRYRGIWYANKENKDADPATLPESKRYQVVELPHGPLLDSELLDAVEVKIADTYGKKKKTGADDHIYLLSHLLVFEDGTSFSGQPAKDRTYRYYYNAAHKIRIRCDQIDPFVVKEIKANFEDNAKFTDLVESAIKRRQSELPRIELQIKAVENELRELDETEVQLRDQLVSRERRTQSSFMDWLSDQVEGISRQRQIKASEFDALNRCRADLLKRSGLADVRTEARRFIRDFDRLTGTEKRNLAERLISRIVVKRGNELELKLKTELSVPRVVTRGKESSEFRRSGGSDGT